MTKTWQVLSVSLVLVLVLTVMPAAAWGEVSPGSEGEAFWQDLEVLVYDEPVEGRIDDQAFTQAWALQSLSADRIRVRVERLKGNLIPDVSIHDFSGNALTRSSADDTRAAALIRDYKLPGAGQYQIVVGRDRGESGETIGAYRLTVQVLGLGIDHPNNTAVVGAVEYDLPVNGEITPDHWQHIYTLNGQAGDLVRVTAVRQDGTLMPRVELQDINEQALANGYADDTGVTAAFNSYELRTEGQYRVLVYRERGIDGDTTGEYALTVTLLGSGETSARLTVPPATFDDYGDVLQGTITHARWYEEWQFTALAGDLITITVARVPGEENTLKPQVILLGGAAQELRRGSVDSTGAAAAIERYRLSTPGTYTVRVMRDRGKSGTTSGQYELTVNLVGAGQGNPALDPISGAIETRVPVEGEVTHARWADTWTYNGVAGEPLDIIVTRTSGTLVPRIDILDANRQSLRSAQPAATADMAMFQRYQLPANAEYYIVVTRDRGQDGTTTGSYTLIIQPTE